MDEIPWDGLSEIGPKVAGTKVTVIINKQTDPFWVVISDGKLLPSSNTSKHKTEEQARTQAISVAKRGSVAWICKPVEVCFPGPVEWQKMDREEKDE